MRITRAATYAVYGLRHLALQGNGQPVAIATVAKAAGLPKAHLAKIFQHLAKKRILRSGRGVGGGFKLNGSPEQFTLLDIIEAVEGPSLSDGCLLTPGPCRLTGHCQVAAKLREAERSMDRVLRETTLQMLIHPEVQCPKPK